MNDEREERKRRFSRMLSGYGMLLVLLGLAAFFSWQTMDVQHPAGAAAGKLVARQTIAETPATAKLLVIARAGGDDDDFTAAVVAALASDGRKPVAVVQGLAVEARKAIDAQIAAGQGIDAILCTDGARQWPLFDNISQRFPALVTTRLISPQPYRWPNFLKLDNLRNVANQIVVIAIIAIGMTLVIITGGIDLSVGSLIALSAVTATLVIARWCGGDQASALGMVGACGVAILLCAGVGLTSGLAVAVCGLPPFIATLGMMLIGSGFAFILSRGESIYQVPETFVRLGRGADLGGIPNSVVLMVVLYVAAHLLMSRTVLGRYIYAIGGNREAARLAGVPVTLVILLVYTLCGALAGLGGIVTASQLKSGAPTYGQMYELYAIAAVVVGGTSLSGGEGRITGTLIGAFIIAVIQNGMNLTGVESYTQKVVLGLVILGAVLLDTIKHRLSPLAWLRRIAGTKEPPRIP